jgi:hypothetical protein
MGGGFIRAGIGHQRRFEAPRDLLAAGDAHPQVLQEPVAEAVDPAVHCQPRADRWPN